MSRKWVIIGERAYPVCPRCGAYPMEFYGRDEYSNYLLRCRRCGILVARRTPPSKLGKRALKRFWGGQPTHTGEAERAKTGE